MWYSSCVKVYTHVYCTRVCLSILFESLVEACVRHASQQIIHVYRISAPESQIFSTMYGSISRVLLQVFAREVQCKLMNRASIQHVSKMCSRFEHY